ncbi:MAG: tetratricopeptide repeat protein [Gammaproteobacteria bacterium]|nr:tetratricopeptide repeat protein [Gammaproteobacteria bacterium]
MKLSKKINRVLLSGLVAAVLFGCGGAEERKAKYLEQGKIYFEQGNYEKAQIEIKNVLQIDPKTAEAYYYLGRIGEQNKSYRKAFSNYLKAVDMDPSITGAHARLAQFYLMMAGAERAKGNEEAAADAIEKVRNEVKEVLTRKPGDPEGLALEAAIMAHEGDTERAITQLESVLKTDPTQDSAVAALAGLYEKQGQMEKSVSVLEAGIESVDDDDMGLHLRLARSHMKQNNEDAAERVLKEMVAKKPDVYKYRVILVTFYYQIEAYDKAETVLRQSITDILAVEDAAEKSIAERYMVLADFLESKRGADVAIKELKQFIVDQPELKELSFSLAKLYIKNEQQNEAVKIYKNLVQLEGLEPMGLRARNRLASIYTKDNELGKARILVAEILQENPRDNNALFLKAQHAVITKDYVTAIAAYRSLLRDMPDSSRILALLAATHQANGESDLALETLRRGVDANSQDVKIRLQLANQLLSANEGKQAEEHIEAVLALDPDNVTALMMKASLLDVAADADALEAIFSKIKSVDSKQWQAYYRMGLVYKQKGNSEAALNEFEQALMINPASPEVLNEVIITQLAMGREVDAEERLNAILKDKPDHASASRLLGMVYLAQKKFDKAEKLFVKQVDANKENGAGYRQLAYSRMMRGDMDGAEKFYKQGIAALPNDARLKMGLGKLYEQRKDIDAALTIYNEVLAVNPDYVAALIAKSNVLAMKSDAEGLENVLRHLQTVAPEGSEGHFRMGRLYKAKGQLEEALSEFEKALERAPESADLLSELIQLQLRLGQTVAAEARIKALLDVRPDHGSAHGLLGLIYMVQKRYDLSEKEFNKQIEINPNDHSSYSQLANVRMAEGDLKGAEKIYKRGLQRLPGNSRLLLGLAGVYERSHDYTAAIKVYERIIKADKKNIVALNNLAALLVEYRNNKKNIQRAVELVEPLRLVRKAAVQDTLGWVNYHAGNYQYAVNVLERVVEAAPHLPLFRYHLGMAQYKNGDKTVGRASLAKALEMDPKFEGSEVARKMLK